MGKKNKETKQEISSNVEHSADFAKPMLSEVLFCIGVLAKNDCWIADWDGDPGRTLIRDNAKTFNSYKEAEKFLIKMQFKYPNRKMWVQVY